MQQKENVELEKEGVFLTEGTRLFHKENKGIRKSKYMSVLLNAGSYNILVILTNQQVYSSRQYNLFLSLVNLLCKPIVQ